MPLASGELGSREMTKFSKTRHFIDHWATPASLRAAAKEQARDGSFAEQTLFHDQYTTRETLTGLQEGGWVMPAGIRRYRFTATGVQTIENIDA
jgi:hypothetical protein